MFAKQDDIIFRLLSSSEGHDFPRAIIFRGLIHQCIGTAIQVIFLVTLQCDTLIDE